MWKKVVVRKAVLALVASVALLTTTPHTRESRSDDVRGEFSYCDQPGVLLASAASKAVANRNRHRYGGTPVYQIYYPVPATLPCPPTTPARDAKSRPVGSQVRG